ncbi:MAG: hypothetical protein V7603_541 [Micromonosporaceae bacterium]
MTLAVTMTLALGTVVASPMPARAASTPLSQNKPVTASSTENAGTPVTAAVDGDTGTRWSSAFNDPQWIQVDLGAPATISRVVLNWEAAYATAFQLQVSDDGAAWTTIHATTTGTGGVQDLAVTGTGRYVRVYGTARATPYGYSLWEFQVYAAGPGPGTFPVTFRNNTGGAFPDSQIFVMVLLQAAAGQWSYLKPDGSLAHINHLDASAPDHLTKNGRDYPNMSFSLARASTVTFPDHNEGARIYLSVGSPMYIAVSPDDRGWAGPDPQNPADPNVDVYYDWYEYSYIFNGTGFGGNTTQVDLFGFPMTARLQQASTGYDQTVGTTLTRSAVFSRYASSVAPAFQPLAGQYRILAPRSSATFRPGGAQGDYLQAYIDQVWNYYTTHPFSLTRLGQTFTGAVSGGVLNGTGSDGSTFSLTEPTSTDVFQCAGALVPPTNDVSRALGAEFCAAFNRGVALDTADWYNPPAYYRTGPKNDYAQFFHSISLQNRAYGFPYDDINDQSSVRILGNSNPPSLLTLGIGW